MTNIPTSMTNIPTSMTNPAPISPTEDDLFVNGIFNNEVLN